MPPAARGKLMKRIVWITGLCSWLFVANALAQDKQALNEQLIAAARKSNVADARARSGTRAFRSYSIESETVRDGFVAARTRAQYMAPSILSRSAKRSTTSFHETFRRKCSSSVAV